MRYIDKIFRPNQEMQRFIRCPLSLHQNPAEAITIESEEQMTLISGENETMEGNLTCVSDDLLILLPQQVVQKKSVPSIQSWNPVVNNKECFVNGLFWQKYKEGPSGPETNYVVYNC